MPTFEQQHPQVITYSRGLLLVIVLVTIGLGLDSAGVRSFVGRAVFLVVMLSVLGTWASWEKKRREHFHGGRASSRTQP